MDKICLSIFLHVVCLSFASASVNLAVGKPAVQSSECCGGAPGRAVSGTPNTHWAHAQCTATTTEVNPWWSVDLGSVEAISRVVLHNRADCCPDRLRNVIVYTVDTPPASARPDKNAATSTVCARFAGPGFAGQVVELDCAAGTQGRYVVVELETTSLLTLCGVEVYGGGDVSVDAGVNVAVGKPAAQSSECCGGNPERAVSGTPNTHWSAGQCTATNTEATPWWSVDLQDTYDISRVVLYNRVDCCPERLRNVVVYSVDSRPSTSSPPNKNAPGASVCSTYAGPGGAGDIVELNCAAGFQGRYIVVQLETTSLLTLCGVEVYSGGAISPAETNIAVGQPAVQSSECCGGAPGRAVSGTPNANWANAQCTATVTEANPWWSVDLGTSYDINRVVIYNRGDCCPERLRDLVVYATDAQPSTNWPPRKDSPSSSVCATWPGPGTAAEVVELSCAAGTEGRYLVVHAEANTLLTLCGVEVYGSGSRVSVGTVNVAVGKPAVQSSECCGGAPQRAVSGTPNTNWAGAQCTATNTEANPWWSVDLEASYEIGRVVIYNRADCCPERLRDLVVYTVDSPPSTSNPPNVNAAGSNQCATWPGPGTWGEIVQIDCDAGAEGQYLVIQSQTTTLLTLCGVEVYAVGEGSSVGGGASAEEVTRLEGELAQALADLQAAQNQLQQAQQCQQDLQAAQAELQEALECQQALQTAQNSLKQCEDAAEPPMPTASPTATLSATGYRFTLDFSGIDYILETTPQHIARDGDEFCEQYGMKLAPVENQQTYDGLVTQLESIAGQTSLTEVAIGERSAVNLDRDAPVHSFNAAGWNCVTFVPDGGSFKTVGKKCNGERAVLCAAIPIYC